MLLLMLLLSMLFAVAALPPLIHTLCFHCFLAPTLFAVPQRPLSCCFRYAADGFHALVDVCLCCHLHFRPSPIRRFSFFAIFFAVSMFAFSLPRL